MRYDGLRKESNMLTGILFFLICLLWVGLGLSMLVFPSGYQGWGRALLTQDRHRFVISQTIIFCGLLLVLGTTQHQGYWLWATLGCLLMLKGLIFLGATDHFKQQLLALWERVPLVMLRIMGLLTITLATYLTIDTVRQLS